MWQSGAWKETSKKVNIAKQSGQSDTRTPRHGKIQATMHMLAKKRSDTAHALSSCSYAWRQQWREDSTELCYPPHKSFVTTLTDIKLQLSVGAELIDQLINSVGLFGCYSVVSFLSFGFHSAHFLNIKFNSAPNELTFRPIFRPVFI